MSKIRTYSELRRLDTFQERFDYLRLDGSVGESTFGFDRWINQKFYASYEWQSARSEVVRRDLGCDLGLPGFEIYTGLLVHHMNPVTSKDLRHKEDWLIDPEYLITTSLRTHNAIHYGDESLLPKNPVVRKMGDTTLW